MSSPGVKSAAPPPQLRSSQSLLHSRLGAPRCCGLGQSEAMSPTDQESENIRTIGSLPGGFLLLFSEKLRHQSSSGQSFSSRSAHVHARGCPPGPRSAKKPSRQPSITQTSVCPSLWFYDSQGDGDARVAAGHQPLVIRHSISVPRHLRCRS